MRKNRRNNKHNKKRNPKTAQLTSLDCVSTARMVTKFTCSLDSECFELFLNGLMDEQNQIFWMPILYFKQFAGTQMGRLIFNKEYERINKKLVRNEQCWFNQLLQLRQRVNECRDQDLLEDRVAISMAIDKNKMRRADNKKNIKLLKDIKQKKNGIQVGRKAGGKVKIADNAKEKVQQFFHDILSEDDMELFFNFVEKIENEAKRFPAMSNDCLVEVSAGVYIINDKRLPSCGYIELLQETVCCMHEGHPIFFGHYLLRKCNLQGSLTQRNDMIVNSVVKFQMFFHKMWNARFLYNVIKHGSERVKGLFDAVADLSDRSMVNDFEFIKHSRQPSSIIDSAAPFFSFLSFGCLSETSKNHDKVLCELQCDRRKITVDVNNFSKKNNLCEDFLFEYMELIASIHLLFDREEVSGIFELFEFILSHFNSIYLDQQFLLMAMSVSEVIELIFSLMEKLYQYPLSRIDKDQRHEVARYVKMIFVHLETIHPSYYRILKNYMQNVIEFLLLIEMMDSSNGFSMRSHVDSLLFDDISCCDAASIFSENINFRMFVDVPVLIRVLKMSPEYEKECQPSEPKEKVDLKQSGDKKLKSRPQALKKKRLDTEAASFELPPLLGPEDFSVDETPQEAIKNDSGSIEESSGCSVIKSYQFHTEPVASLAFHVADEVLAIASNTINAIAQSYQENMLAKRKRLESRYQKNISVKLKKELAGDRKKHRQYRFELSRQDNLQKKEQTLFYRDIVKEFSRLLSFQRVECAQLWMKMMTSSVGVFSGVAMNMVANFMKLDFSFMLLQEKIAGFTNVHDQVNARGEIFSPQLPLIKNQSLHCAGMLCSIKRLLEVFGIDLTAETQEESLSLVLCAGITEFESRIISAKISGEEVRRVRLSVKNLLSIIDHDVLLSFYAKTANYYLTCYIFEFSEQVLKLFCNHCSIDDVRSVLFLDLCELLKGELFRAEVEKEVKQLKMHDVLKQLGYCELKSHPVVPQLIKEKLHDILLFIKDTGTGIENVELHGSTVRQLLNIPVLSPHKNLPSDYDLTVTVDNAAFNHIDKLASVGYDLSCATYKHFSFDVNSIDHDIDVLDVTINPLSHPFQPLLLSDQVRVKIFSMNGLVSFFLKNTSLAKEQIMRVELIPHMSINPTVKNSVSHVFKTSAQVAYAGKDKTLHQATQEVKNIYRFFSDSTPVNQLYFLQKKLSATLSSVARKCPHLFCIKSNRYLLIYLSAVLENIVDNREIEDLLMKSCSA